jgi:hypothetical protein
MASAFVCFCSGKSKQCQQQNEKVLAIIILKLQSSEWKKSSAYPLALWRNDVMAVMVVVVVVSEAKVDIDRDNYLVAQVVVVHFIDKLSIA